MLITIFLWILGYLFMGWLTLIAYVRVFDMAKDIEKLTDVDNQELEASGLLILFWPIALTVLFALVSIQWAVRIGKRSKKKVNAFDKESKQL